jgi:hypothetical protein
MIRLGTALLLATTLAAAAAAVPKLGPGWVAAPLQDGVAGEYVRYVRQEQDGSESALNAIKQVCQCQPATATRMIKTALASVPGASLTSDKTVECGLPAEHLIATGIAREASTQRNFVMFVFRFGPAIYTLQYTFPYAKPMPDAVSALAALCPNK